MRKRRAGVLLAFGVAALMIAGCSSASGRSTAPSSAPSGSTRSPALFTVTIPARNGFKPRTAWVYLPAAVQADPERRAPVLELLHGTPGSPVDWVRRGDVQGIVSTFERAHPGRAPIVVIPDLNGAQRADSECIRTASGADVESYLTTDVATWVRTHYGPTVGRERLWVAGLSEGGICAVMLALRHPDLYSVFGDFSGLAAPIVEHKTQAQSNRQLYGGNRADQLAHEPLWLLTHRHYTDLVGWFECGRDDHKVLPQIRQVAAAATRAGLPNRLEVVPGKHVWSVWQAGLRNLLPWAAAH